MPQTHKKVLIIAYYFPPSGGPAVQRILRLLKHLRNLGWQPVILTVRNGDYPTVDATLLQKIPTEIAVHRTFIPEPYRVYRRLTGRQAGEAVDLSSLSLSVGAKTNFSERLAGFIRSVFFIPDARIGWLPFALFKGYRLLKKERFDLIFSSGPPNTVHLVAYGLRKLTGLRWVADFRDPWFKYLAPERNFVLPQRIDAALSRMVVQNADHRIWVCEGVREEIEASHGHRIVPPSTVITNGYDKEEFDEVSRGSDHSFTICYVGSLFIKYDLTAFIDAFQEIFDNDAEFRRHLKIVFCGRVDAGIERRLKTTNFAACVDFLGYQSHDRTIQMMRSASVLLLYIIDSERGKRIPTGKLFEYIGARRPILALAPQDSEAADIIQETGSGTVVHPTELTSISRCVQILFKQWQRNELKDFENNQNILAYESQVLAAQFVKVWDELTL